MACQNQTKPNCLYIQNRFQPHHVATFLLYKPKTPLNKSATTTIIKPSQTVLFVEPNQTTLRAKATSFHRTEVEPKQNPNRCARFPPEPLAG